MVYEIIEDDGYRQLTGLIFPPVRRVHSKLITNHLVGRQPMTAPVGNIFYMVYIYGAGNKIDIEKKLLTCNGDKEMKEMFLQYIRKNWESKLLEVVKEKYPEYVEMLEKLLVLK
jgi:hypothetical protein